MRFSQQASIISWMGDATPRSRAFRHEAFLYYDREDFVEGVADFVADGLVRGEPAVIAVGGEKIETLKAVLKDEKGVFFVDMDEVGRNPACLIPAYHDFIRNRAGNAPCRGVGEPVGPHRRGAELTECQIHESLCNLAFAATSWWVVCPYDTSELDQAVIQEAHRSHPVLLETGGRRGSAAYHAPAPSGPLGAALPDPPAHAHQLEFAAGGLRSVRQFITDQATALGLDPDRISKLTRAVDEVVTNSLRHATGDGKVDTWVEGSMVVAEVRDQGHIEDPLVGRHPPVKQDEAGRGLRMVNRLCDLVQVRSAASGTTVRLHMALRR